MEIQKQWQKLEVDKIIIQWRELVLNLKRTFNTAHSSSSQRHNFLVRVSLEGKKQVGLGQCGLPPKKAHCYLADLDDCHAFMGKLAKILTEKDVRQISQKADIFEQVEEKLFSSLQNKYFSCCREKELWEEQNCEKRQLKMLMIILLLARQNLPKEERAPYNALQFAVFDIWAKMRKKSLTNLVFGDMKKEPSKVQPCSFYSISHQAHGDMLENIREGLKFTSFIKLKYNDDIENLLLLLSLVQKEVGTSIAKYIIDANASWSVDNCRSFVGKIQDQKYTAFRKKLLYLQQPFPVVIPEEDKEKWRSVFQQCEGVLRMVADQSFFSEQQIPQVKQFCHGVNIKTEKAGGIINSLKAGIRAREENMEVMLGSMVTTHLGATQTYCLYPLTQFLDTDGSLLVGDPSVKGGFEWGKNGYLQESQKFLFGNTIDPESFP